MRNIFLFFLIIQSNAFGQSPSIQLNFPENFDTIHTEYPNFVWNIYDIDFSDRSSYNVRLTLVELQADQSAGNGLATNTPIHIAENLKIYNYSYPFGSYELIKGKSYGWHIQLFNGSQKIAESEPYVFTLFEELSHFDYGIMSSNPSNVIYNTREGTLHFIYEISSIRLEYNFIVTSEEIGAIDVTILNEKELITSNQKLLFNKVGKNYFKLSLPEGASLGKYLLKVTDSRGDTKTLRFKVK